MSPDRAPRTFGRTPLQTARGTILFAAFGMGAMIGLARLFSRSQTPLGLVFQATGLPPQTPYLIGGALVLLLAGWASVYAARSAETYLLSDRGLEVRGWLGAYCLEWGNVTDVVVAEGGNLGIRVRSRDAVLATHRGSAKQREWLRTQEPYGEWDYLYTRSDLGRPAQTVCGWIQSFRGSGGE